jgi:hypothetical protein
MKLLTICLSVLILASCKSGFPTIEPQERCFMVLETELDQTYTGYCRCHMYQWSSSYIGRVSESVNHELSYCDKMGGFSPESVGNIYIWQEDIRLWLNRIGKKK